MGILNKLKKAAAKEVIGSTLKSGLPVEPKAFVTKSRLAVGLGAIAAVIGYIANYIG